MLKSALSGFLLLLLLLVVLVEVVVYPQLYECAFECVCAFAVWWFMVFAPPLFRTIAMLRVTFVLSARISLSKLTGYCCLLAPSVCFVSIGVYVCELGWLRTML